MKVDAYKSTVKPTYGIIVAAGVDPSTLSGEAQSAIASLSPLTNEKKNVDLASIAAGDLLESLEKQITESGAGLIKTKVNFQEVAG